MIKLTISDRRRGEMVWCLPMDSSSRFVCRPYQEIVGCVPVTVLSIIQGFADWHIPRGGELIIEAVE